VTDQTVPAMESAAIAADLERRITEGEFVVGNRMPSEMALAGEYDVSRARVRGSLASLARRGLLVSRPNSGWIVQARHQTQGFDRMRSFTQWAEEHGRVAAGHVQARVHGGANAREARLLQIRMGERVLRFTRLRTLDGRVVMVERSSWAPWVMPMVEAMPDDVVSTTSALAEQGIRVVVGDHRIEAVAASSEDARLLGVRRSSPLLQVARTTATREGRVVEVGVDRYVPDVIAFEISAGEAVRSSP
jgi:GntR family transcriptional regulator